MLRRSTERRLSLLDGALRAQARHRWMWVTGLAAAMLLLAVLASVRSGPAATGTVTGYIQPCVGRPFPRFTSTGARVFSDSGTVEALRGKEYLKPVDRWNSTYVFPAAVAARERVAQNQKFHLGALSPGQYVILAHYARGNGTTWRDVSVVAGRSADVDLPDMCK